MHHQHMSQDNNVEMSHRMLHHEALSGSSPCRNLNTSSRLQKLKDMLLS